MALHIFRLQVEERPPIQRVAVSILINQLRTADKWWSSSFGVGELLTIPERKKLALIHNGHIYLRPGLNLLISPKKWIRDMRFGTWKERSLYR